MFSRILTLFALVFFLAGGSAAGIEAHIKEEGRHPSTQQEGMNVNQILFDRMEGNTIYSKDGSSFSISSDTRVTDKRDGRTRTSTAELVFIRGRLIAVTIR